MMRRIAGWVLLAFAVFVLVTNPVGAAGTVRYVLAGVGHVAAALGTFAAALGHSSHPAAPAALPYPPTSLGGLL